MAAQWHYGQGEEQHGPVPLEELKQLVASGQVQPTDMVWNAAMPDWLPAGDVEELFPKQKTASERAAAEPVPEPSPSGSSRQPSDAAAAIRKPLSSHRNVVGIAALCAVLIIVVASVYIFGSRKHLDKTAGKGVTKQEQSEELPENVENAMATLTTNPADPDANLAVGRYHCFRKGDWDKGLPMLAQGSDASLKELATADLRKPTAPEEQMKLGDGWWDFAGNKLILTFKGSEQRGAYWYRKAVVAGSTRKAEIEEKVAAIQHVPDGFEVIKRHVGSIPDKDSYEVRCTHLSLEVTKTGKKDPQKPRTLGLGIAGLELKGARRLDLKVKSSPDLEGESGNKRNKNVFAGFMVDYQTAEGYAKRVALCLTAFSKERDVNTPGWGKKSVPDDYVDLGRKDSYQLDLQKWAPPGWTGQVWFGVVLQQHKPNMFLKAAIVPQVASQGTGSSKQKIAQKPVEQVAPTPVEPATTAIAQAENKSDGGKQSAGSSAVVPGASATNAGMRKWTRSTNGKEFEAEFVRYTPGVGVVLKLPNGNEITVKLVGLSEEDSKYVKQTTESQGKAEPKEGGEQKVTEQPESATKPVPRNGPRDKGWTNRHLEINERVKQGHVDLVFIGDGITRQWESKGNEVWNQYYGNRNAVNLGISGDRTQHVLWRLQNGNLDGISPRLAVLMIGSNNSLINPPEEVAAGVKAIVAEIHARVPTTKVLVLAIFPRGPNNEDPKRQANIKANAIIAEQVAGDPLVQFLDIGPKFVKADGVLTEELMMPNLANFKDAAAYKVWAEAIEPIVAKELGEQKVAEQPAPTTNAEMRKWTKKDGTTIEASYVGYEHRSPSGGTKGSQIVTLQKQDGTTITMHLGTLSLDDLAYVGQILTSQGKKVPPSWLNPKSEAQPEPVKPEIAAKEQPAPQPEEPAMVTPDYLPHKVGALAHYTIYMYTKPDAGIGMDHDFAFADGGVVEHTIVRAWMIQNGEKGKSQWLNKRQADMSHRIRNDFVETGSVLEGAGFVWEPTLKIGAKVGDKWDGESAPKFVTHYSVIEFGSYTLPINGKNYTTVTIREDDAAGTRYNRYAKGIGLIHREIRRKGDDKVVGEWKLDDTGGNLTTSELKFFDGDGKEASNKGSSSDGNRSNTSLGSGYTLSHPEHSDDPGTERAIQNLRDSGRYTPERAQMIRRMGEVSREMDEKQRRTMP
jgi:beta-glucosidase